MTGSRPALSPVPKLGLMSGQPGALIDGSRSAAKSRPIPLVGLKGGNQASECPLRPRQAGGAAARRRPLSEAIPEPLHRSPLHRRDPASFPAAGHRAGRRGRRD